MTIPANSIKVEPPYSELYDKGHFNIDYGNFKVNLFLTNTKTFKRLEIGYARYLMSVKLGRILNKNERVYFIDKNPLNVDINNLELREIKISDNKEPKPSTLDFKEISCTYCNRSFFKQIYKIKECNFCNEVCRSKHINRQSIIKNPGPKIVKPHEFPPIVYGNREYIPVQGPFKELYEDAFIVYNKSIPPIVRLKKIGYPKFTVRIFLYRYLLSIKINRIIKSGEAIAYLDGDSNNKSIDNIVLKDSYLLSMAPTHFQE